MNVQRIAAFSNGHHGGNPAGVVIANTLPNVTEMQRIAAEVGFSETAFAAPKNDAFIVRYFSPESEVPFCGHATIALGVALARQYGDGKFQLFLESTEVSVQAIQTGDLYTASLQSPPTESAIAAPGTVSRALELFGLAPSDLDERITPAFVQAGARHLLLVLRNRDLLSGMEYDLGVGRSFMQLEKIVTISLVVLENDQVFHSRNAFASGGVLEDPATGAAAAALAGYLRDINWPHNGEIEVIQGEDMGMASRLRASFSGTPGSSITVSGTARMMVPGE